MRLGLEESMSKKTITRIFCSIVILGFVFATIISFLPSDQKSNSKQNLGTLQVENLIS